MVGRNEPCSCGTGIKFKNCCGKAEPAPAVAPVTIKQGEVGYSHPKCYLAATNRCSNTISGEHHISKAILEMVMGAVGQTTTDAFPYGPARKSIPISGWVSNVLCTRHNSDLAAIDNTGIALFRATMQALLRKDDAPTEIWLSGHDLERYLLQRLCAQHFGGVTSQNRVKSDHVLDRGLVERALVINQWPAGAGLYVTAPENIPQYSFNEPCWEFAPMFLEDRVTGAKSVSGCRLVYNRLFMRLILAPNALTLGLVDQAVYRPTLISMQPAYLGRKLDVHLSWLPGSSPGGIVNYPSDLIPGFVPPKGPLSIEAMLGRNTIK